MAVIDPGRNDKEFQGISVVQSAQAALADVIVITCAQAPQHAFNAVYGSGRDSVVLAPPLLRISRQGSGVGEAP
ncbi:hypothetical protein IQ256_28255 [cf. Phormidesmis sp. LEGE 11477]|nr:hypothetical protein [cf. Phormidesmis sp. LEGE 11477]